MHPWYDGWRRLAVLPVAMLVLMALGACETFGELGGERVGTASPGASGEWLEQPREYATRIASAEAPTRARERQQALAALLREPRADSAVRAQLIYSAAVLDVEEAYQARDEIASALNQASTPFAKAVLTSLDLSIEQRQSAYREALEQENLRNVEVQERTEVELERDRLVRERARLARALEEAQGRLRALMSIEEQLQSDGT
ncbi:MAG: hypothetical protein AAGA68_05165 [Pseudomonadota bacterium]